MNLYVAHDLGIPVSYKSAPSTVAERCPDFLSVPAFPSYFSSRRSGRRIGLLLFLLLPQLGLVDEMLQQFCHGLLTLSLPGASSG